MKAILSALAECGGRGGEEYGRRPPSRLANDCPDRVAVGGAIFDACGVVSREYVFSNEGRVHCLLLDHDHLSGSRNVGLDGVKIHSSRGQNNLHLTFTVLSAGGVAVTGELSITGMFFALFMKRLYCISFIRYL